MPRLTEEQTSTQEILIRRFKTAINDWLKAELSWIGNMDPEAADAWEAALRRNAKQRIKNFTKLVMERV